MSEYSIRFTGILIGNDGVERHFVNGAYTALVRNPAGSAIEFSEAIDAPAVIYPNGTRLWYIENPKRGAMMQPSAILHRDGDKPAVIESDGSEFYYRMGKLDRDHDLPAVILADGTRKWYKNGTCIAYKLPLTGKNK